MKNLLLVDDDEQYLHLLQKMLTQRGYQVTTAVNGQQALAVAQNTPPDLIISDVLMPTMDGYTLCYFWMQDARLRQIPFILYTAVYTDGQDRELAASLGAARFIAKPASLELIVQEIENAITQTIPPKTAVPTDKLDSELGFLKKYNERLVQKLEEKMLESLQAQERLKILYQTSIQLNTIKPLRQLIAHALTLFVNAVDATYANYFVYDTEMEIFHLLEGVGYSDAELADQRQKLVFKLGEPRGLVGLVGQTKTPLLLPDTDVDPRWLSADPAIRSALFLPLTHKSALLGVISFLSQSPAAFSEKDIHNIMTLTNNISLALRNAQLFEAQQQYTTQLEQKVAARTAELEIALAKAESATRLKSQFISDMNHELRTPLSNIKLYLQLLEYGNEENRARYMETLHRETNRLHKMIEELLDLSRLDLGKITVKLAPTDINQLVGSLIIDRAELAKEKGMSLDFLPMPNLEYAMADSQLLFQVLTNLLANAVNYTHAGGSIWLQTETAVAHQQRWVTISIIDNGPGITNEDLPHIFDRFYRGQASRDSGAPGTGLGLAICQEIMEHHDGRISVESIPGMGSKFTVWLKACPQNPEG